MEADAFARSLVKTQEYAKAEDARMVQIARNKGRPRKNADGGREANPMEFGGGSANYARSMVRRDIKDAKNWIEFAGRKGTVIKIEDYL